MDEVRTAKLKAQLRQQVDEEFAKRAHEHRVKVHAIKAPARHRKANKLKATKPSPGLPRDRRLLV